MTERTIVTVHAHAVPVDVDAARAPGAWLAETARAHECRWLLAHADDGVIWGAFADGELETSHDVDSEVSPPLRWPTLQSARLFGPAAEVLVWRDGDGVLHGRAIAEAEATDPDWRQAVDERQLLWGTHGVRRGRFTSLRDGAQGLRHTVPLALDLGPDGALAQRPRLVVRHYLCPTGWARVVASRLVELVAERIPEVPA